MKIIKRQSARQSQLLSNSITNVTTYHNNYDNDNVNIDEEDISTIPPSSLTTTTSPINTTNTVKIEEELSNFSDYSIEQILKDRSIYLACKLKQKLSTMFDGCQLILPESTKIITTNATSFSSSRSQFTQIPLTDFTKTLADRIYTYLFFTTSSILSPNHPARLKILSILSDQLSLQGDAQLANKSFGELSFFTMRFTLDHYFKHSILPCQKTLIVEKARNIIEKSVESENKLSESERTFKSLNNTNANPNNNNSNDSFGTTSLTTSHPDSRSNSPSVNIDNHSSSILPSTSHSPQPLTSSNFVHIEITAEINFPSANIKETIVGVFHIFNLKDSLVASVAAFRRLGMATTAAIKLDEKVFSVRLPRKELKFEVEGTELKIPTRIERQRTIGIKSKESIVKCEAIFRPEGKFVLSIAMNTVIVKAMVCNNSCTFPIKNIWRS
ncbi:10094_t:CDS:2 [Entrophospora sp. SA101]|nr:10094_t:CDS:2 [Entrophospora sp. SA101]